MIRCNIPGFQNGNGGPRWGDCTIMDDGTNYIIIDGYCGQGKDILFRRVKEIMRLHPDAEFDLFLTHLHYDHYHGLRQMIKDSSIPVRSFSMYDPYSLKPFNKEIRDEINTGKAIVKEAQGRGITVNYLMDGDDITLGDIHFEVYRQQPQTFNGNSDSYINDGSLAFWFPDLGYLTTGDGNTRVGNLHPTFVKIGHHGNFCVRANAKYLYANGCKFCWDNDYSTKITDFLQTGRENCLAVGMRFFSIHGDINFVSFDGKVVIYKGSNHYSYACAYKGARKLKDASLSVVERVLEGSLGNDDTRITHILDEGFSPTSVQNHVNKVVKLVKG